MADPEAAYGERIERLAEQYRSDSAAFEPPAEPPAPDRAMGYLRDGLGPTIMVYVDARANDSGVTFAKAEYEQLHEALNGYLELYAACYGVELTADFTIREAAELLIDTHNVQDVAAMLTHVPERGTEDG